MKVLSKSLTADTTFSKLAGWGRLITIAGSTQLVIQGISIISGLLVIRLLPTNEYALYTLANTMLGTMTILADGGIANGVMSEGGRVWKDRARLGAVLATGFKLRKRFAARSLLIAIPVLIYLLRHHGSSWLMSVLIVVSLVPAFFTTLSGTLLQIVPKLQQDIAPLQRNQVEISAGRLLMLLITLFAFPWAFVAIIGVAPVQVWGNVRLRKIAGKSMDVNQQADPEIEKSILKTVKRILPTSIYYCLSGQVTLWIISIFGTTTSLANVGALSRLTMALGLFGTLFTTMIVPRFARLPKVNKLIVTRFFMIQVGLVVLSAVIIATVGFFSKNILWVLGDNFSGLTEEVVLITISSCISLISVSTNQLLSARGIIIPPAIFISSAILVQIGIAFTVPLHELKGVLLYGIYTTFFIYLIRLLYLVYTIAKKP